MATRTKSIAPPAAGGSIRVGNINNATGIAIGPGAQAAVIHGGLSDEAGRAFAEITARVDALADGFDKAMAGSAVKALEAEAGKGERAEERSVVKWLDFLAQTAPDAWEVAADTFLNPIRGLGTAFRKVAERARAERKAQDKHNDATHDDRRDWT